MEIHKDEITVVVWNHSLMIHLSFRKSLQSLMVLTDQTIFFFFFFKVFIIVSAISRYLWMEDVA